MKTLMRSTLLTSISVLFLLGGVNAAFASSPQNLQVTVLGGVSNLGTQFYNVSGGTTLLQASDFR